MRMARNWAGALVLGVVVGCGGDDGAQSDAGVAPKSVTQLVGPEGATVELVDGAKVEISPGALSEPTQIKITELDADALSPLPSTLEVAGKPYAFEPHGLTFTAPVKIDVPFTGDATEVRPVKLNDEDDTTWTTVYPHDKDTPARKLSLETTSFSIYMAARPRRQSGVITLPDGAVVTIDGGGDTRDAATTDASVDGGVDARVVIDASAMGDAGVDAQTPPVDAGMGSANLNSGIGARDPFFMQNEGGQRLAVWTHGLDGDLRPAAATFDGSLWSPVRVLRDTAAYRVVGVRGALGEDGSAMVTWREQDRTDTTQRGWFARFDGTAWGVAEPLPLPPERTIGDVRVAALGGGRYVAVMIAYLALEMYATEYDPMEDTWSEPVMIDSALSNVPNTMEIVHNGSGLAALVYHRTSVTPSSNRAVYVLHYAVGSGWATPYQLYTPITSRMNAAMDAVGNLVVAVTPLSVGTAQTFVYDAQMAMWSTPEPITTFGNSVGACVARVAFLPGGDPIAVNCGNPGTGSHSVYARRYLRGQGVWTPSTEVVTEIGNAGIAIGSGGVGATLVVRRVLTVPNRAGLSLHTYDTSMVDWIDGATEEIPGSLMYQHQVLVTADGRAITLLAGAAGLVEH